MFKTVVAAAAVLFALSAPAWAADSNTLQLFRGAQRQVLGYPHFTVFDSVHIRVDGSIVELTGKVTMPHKSSDIAKRVAKVAGVTQVVNRIELLPVSRFDDELRYRIARAIYGNANFWGYGSMVNPPIHVIVDHGRVTLEGVVNSNVDRMLARSIASSFPAFSLANELKTEAEVKAELEKL
ncbi:MAG: BON domain-containing protein [Vicinamibacterales bacterium]